MTWRRLSMSIVFCAGLALTGCSGPKRTAGWPTGSPSATPSPSATATPTGPSSPSSPSPSPSSPSAGTAPAPSGLIAFLQVKAVDSTAASEVTTPAQLDRFLAGVPEAGPKVRDAVAHSRRTGVRLFAFVLTGCQNDSASLVIQRSRVYAFLTGGAGTRCFVAEYYVAAFAVPAGEVPTNVRIG